MVIGQSLKRFRKKFNLTQTNVADKLGIMQQTYYKYENDKMTPSAEFVLKLANAYDVSADYLLGRSDEPRPPKLDADTMEFLKMAQAWKNSPAKVTA